MRLIFVLIDIFAHKYVSLKQQMDRLYLIRTYSIVTRTKSYVFYTSIQQSLLHQKNAKQQNLDRKENIGRQEPHVEFINNYKNQIKQGIKQIILQILT